MHAISIRPIRFATLGLLLLPGAALAQEGGLYAAPPPVDAAFVRVLNSNPTAESDLNVGPTAFTVPPSTVSAYSYVTKGDYDTSGGPTLHLSLQAQQYYTILIAPDGTASLLQDEALKNPARAGLYFYNASNTPLQLDATVGGKEAAVFQAVPPGKGTFREVNAFEVAFTGIANGQPAFTLPATTLERQQGLTVVAMQNGDKINGIQTVNSVSSAK